MSKLHDNHFRQEFYRLIAYNRDINDGKGERDVTYMLLWAATLVGYGDEVIEILKLFASKGFGYWGDFANFYVYLKKVPMDDYPTAEAAERKETMKGAIVEVIVNQLRNDQRLLIQHQKNAATTKAPSISLAAKWVPSEGKKYDSLAEVIASALFPGKATSETKSLAKYRHLTSTLRSNLNLVESKMSKSEWGAIDPSAIPAKTMKKNRKVFMNSKGSLDEGRVLLAEKLSLLINGKTDKTIKTKGLQFYELIKPYTDGEGLDEVIEAQAKTIIKDMRALVENGSFPLSVALCDVSGSMSGIPMIVSIALGIIIANVMPDPWRGKVITFESNPRWVEIPLDGSIYNQVRVLRDAPWGGSTNFAAAVDLILKKALVAKEPKRIIPEMLFCFTDMQFNQASERNTFVIDELKQKFQSHGLVMPNLVLWNLRASGTSTFAADKDTTGVGILSGFSQATFKAFMSGCNFDLLTPIYLLKESLHVARYDVIAQCAK